MCIVYSSGVCDTTIITAQCKGQQVPVRMVVTRTTGNGEQFSADVCQWNPVTGTIEHENVEEMHQLVDDCFKIVDTRLYEMNLRVLEANRVQEYVTPEEWSKIVSILNVLNGQMSIEQVVRDWKASKEETHDLEAGRLEAMQHYEQQQQMIGPDPCVYCDGVYGQHYIGCPTLAKAQ